MPESATALAIRPAHVGDVPLILAFIRELAEYEHAPDEVVATEALLRDRLFGEQPAAEVLIAEADGLPAGFALFFHTFSTWKARRGLWLEDLFVRPQFRGAGVGLALMRQLAHIAVQRDCARFEWSVLDWNTPAIAFYRRLGATGQDEWTTQRMQGEALAALAAQARP
ncbi:MAG: GNAT family N-acetyltransferase [Pseudoxanthomonas suwonensis]|nr:GNAT family N-acetyltransferase [Pseudoxanthomonas suwonensis]